MTKSTHIFSYSVVGLLASAMLATVASAETYYYVASDGSLQEEQAVTSNQAITTAPNIKYNSGVISKEDYMELIGDTTVVTSEPTTTNYTLASDTTTGEAYDMDTETYLYVNSMNQLMAIEAKTPTEAINIAPNIKYNSGVMVELE